MNRQQYEVQEDEEAAAQVSESVSNNNQINAFNCNNQQPTIHTVSYQHHLLSLLKIHISAYNKSPIRDKNHFLVPLYVAIMGGFSNSHMLYFIQYCYSDFDLF